MKKAAIRSARASDTVQSNLQKFAEIFSHFLTPIGILCAVVTLFISYQKWVYEKDGIDIDIRYSATYVDRPPFDGDNSYFIVVFHNAGKEAILIERLAGVHLRDIGYRVAEFKEPEESRQGASGKEGGLLAIMPRSVSVYNLESRGLSTFLLANEKGPFSLLIHYNHLMGSFNSMESLGNAADFLKHEGLYMGNVIIEKYSGLRSK